METISNNVCNVWTREASLKPSILSQVKFVNTINYYYCLLGLNSFFFFFVKCLLGLNSIAVVVHILFSYENN